MKLPAALVPFVQLTEKAAATFVQAFLGVLIVGSSMGTSTAQAAAIAALPTALTVVANGLSQINPKLPLAVDVLYRTVRTYVVSFLGFLLAMPTFHLDYSAAVAASSSALPSAMAVVKGAVASFIGDRSSAALLPAAADTRAAA